MNLLARNLPSGRHGRLLAVALLLLALGFVSALVVVPLIDWYRVRTERVVEQQQLLTKQRRLILSLPLLRRQVSQANAGSMVDALLGGNNDAIAGAALQAAVQDMATTAGSSLSSTEVLAGEQQGDFRRIGLRVTLNCNWPALVALMRAVEESPKQLLVDDLQLHTIAQLQGAGPQQLNASFVVLGFRSGREAAPQEGARP